MDILQHPQSSMLTPFQRSQALMNRISIEAFPEYLLFEIVYIISVNSFCLLKQREMILIFHPQVNNAWGLLILLGIEGQRTIKRPFNNVKRSSLPWQRSCLGWTHRICMVHAQNSPESECTPPRNSF